MEVLGGTVFIDDDLTETPAKRSESSEAFIERSRTSDAIHRLDRRTIAFAARAYPVVTRSALFVVFFWFGVVKLIGHSEATGLALALANKTVGPHHFTLMFDSLAVAECIIGVLYLFPRAVRVVTAMLAVHMTVVCAPLLLVPQMTWQHALVPTMVGQYIIKNVLVVAAALVLLAQAPPLRAPGLAAQLNRS